MEKTPFRYLWHYIRIFKLLVVSVLALNFLSQLCGQVYPLYLAKIYSTAAGEVEEPARNIPRAINQVLLRILIFYVGAIGVMLIIWPWDQVGTEGSPFVLMLVGLGIGGAATLLNIVVLTAALSVANVMTYSNARVLYDLAASGQAQVVRGRQAEHAGEQHQHADLHRHVADGEPALRRAQRDVDAAGQPALRVFSFRNRT